MQEGVDAGVWSVPKRLSYTQRVALPLTVRVFFHSLWMANAATLAAARKARQEQQNDLAAAQRAQAVANLQISLASSPLSSSVTGRLGPADDFAPLEFPDSDTPMAPPSDDGSEISAPATRSRSHPKRKSAAVSEVSDPDGDAPAKPPRKKPGPKPKPKPVVVSSDSDEEPRVKKKPAAASKSKTKSSTVSSSYSFISPTHHHLEGRKKKTKDSDVESVEVPPNPDIVFMIPEGSSEGNRRVSITASTSFDDAVELIHETIGKRTPDYPQTPVAPPAPAPAPAPGRALPPMFSSDPPDEFAPSYPLIAAFIESLISKTPQRHSLRDVAETFESLRFFDISEITDLTAKDLGEPKFGSVILGDAQFLVKEVAKEVKWLDKLARRARYQ
ncbi:hypothetical protein C8R46DRAFT_1048062 [Mycena filopes]|nr:hypothetical protein C8R46DRAFT_1048062 [Mycena filopes]